MPKTRRIEPNINDIKLNLSIGVVKKLIMTTIDEIGRTDSKDSFSFFMNIPFNLNMPPAYKLVCLVKKIIFRIQFQRCLQKLNCVNLTIRF